MSCHNVGDKQSQNKTGGKFFCLSKPAPPSLPLCGQYLSISMISLSKSYEERYITGSEFSNKMCAFQIKFNAYCLKRAVGHETKCCWPRNKLHRFQRFPIKILCSQSSSAWREDNVKFDQQPLQKSASCWREGSLGFHCLLSTAQRKVHVTWTFFMLGLRICVIFQVNQVNQVNQKHV